MLVKNLWSLLAIWIASYLALFLIEDVTAKSEPDRAQALVFLILAVGYLALALIPGFKGNEWREESFTSRICKTWYRRGRNS
jgi:hypothetical protein